MTTRDPLRIDITRGENIESEHDVDIVIADRRGTTEAWGEPARPTIPRSAIKSIQALPLIASGAADALDVSDAELGLACASHSGEQAHIDAVVAWLDRIGLSTTDLECGPDLPLGTDAAAEVHRAGGVATPVYNCCSGKHAGFLTIAEHLGIAPKGYIGIDHPVQTMIADVVAEMTGHDLDPASHGIDGCGIPVFAIPLERLATGMARLADPADLSDELATAASRLVTVLPEAAFWVSGTGRMEMRLAEVATEPVIAKTGAEGVFMAALPNRGIGIALKARDGNKRAADAAIGAVLHRLGALSEEPDHPISNKAGQSVGAVISRI